MTDALLNHPRYQIEFIVLSFEGPDLYSLVGGLGVRVTEMTRVMASMGYKTRLFFVGDPDQPDYEVSDGLLHYHRWSRWLSKQYPKGVYHGEIAKVEDYQKSVPEFLLSKIIGPNAQDGIITVVVGEDWQTAHTLIRLSQLLEQNSLSAAALLFWNANNVFGFETIDFPKLAQATQLLTISRYMKERMRSMQLETLVIGNGIPRRYWGKIDKAAGARLQAILGGTILTKVGRYHPDKRWLMAMETLPHCRSLGLEVTLLVRGASEEYGETVRARAAELGLSWVKVRPSTTSLEDIFAALSAVKGADVIELDFFVPEDFLRLLYWASTAVLANSAHEPFGLVGLEVMACGGVAVTGCTGEEYVNTFHNAIALSSNDPRELALYVKELTTDFRLVEKIRHEARRTAKLYDWQTVVEDFLRKVELCAWRKDITLRSFRD